MNFDLTLDGKAAIINGGTMGLGKGIATGLASFGFKEAEGNLWRDCNRY